MRMFGVFHESSQLIGGFPSSTSTEGSKSENSEQTLMPILRTVSNFRDQVRLLAQNKSDPSEILQVCDKLRDDDLQQHGIVLEDREGAGALVKLVDKATLIAQKAEKIIKEADKKREKILRLQLEAKKKEERLLKGKTSASEMFKTNEFSAWDDKVPF